MESCFHLSPYFSDVLAVMISQQFKMLHLACDLTKARDNPNPEAECFDDKKSSRSQADLFESRQLTTCLRDLKMNFTHFAREIYSDTPSL